MPYAQIDTEALTHPKVLGLSDAAFRVWVASLAYCQRHLTDGALPEACLVALGVRVVPKMVEELLGRRLWDRTDDGYQVHDYLQWNTSRAVVEQKRAEARGRMARARAHREARSPVGSHERSHERSREQGGERSQNVPYAYSVQRSEDSSGEGEREREGPPAPGHQQHAFCGRRFCVPRWLDAEFRSGLGPEALEQYDLDAWYASLDDEMHVTGAPLLPDPKGWLQLRYREVLRDTFGGPARLRRVR